MNQEIKKDAGKYRPTLVPLKGLCKRVAPVREFGVAKYGDADNWKKVEVQRYKDAFMRHTLSWLEDPKSRDPESGLLHFDHMLCNACFLAELEDGDENGGDEDGEL